MPDPPSTGFAGSHFINVGEIKNTGIEVLLTGSPVYRRNLQWDATVAFSTNDNELVSWGDAPLETISLGSFSQVQKHVPGFPLGGFWSHDVVRDASGNPVLTNGDVTLESAADCAAGDETCIGGKRYLGPSLPTREIGFTNTFTLFNDVRIFTNLDYKGGNYQWCAICSIRSRFDLNTLVNNDPNTTPEELALIRSQQTERWLKKADFIKLREVALSYNLPASVVERAGLSSLAVTLSGRNLWLWTKYKWDEQEGFGSPDPEVNFSSTSSSTAAPTTLPSPCSGRSPLASGPRSDGGHDHDDDQ